MLFPLCFKSILAKMMVFFYDTVENVVRKGVNAGHHNVFKRLHNVFKRVLKSLDCATQSSGSMTLKDKTFEKIFSPFLIMSSKACFFPRIV